jgi:hypothetical protein
MALNDDTMNGTGLPLMSRMWSYIIYFSNLFRLAIFPLSVKLYD